MDKKQYNAFERDIQKIRDAVVKLKGPFEGISNVKKVKKASKKQDAVLSVSNVIEKE